MSNSKVSSRLLAMWAAVATALVASPAFAATIDFTDAGVWGSATGNGSYTATVGGVGVTATAQPLANGATLFQSGYGMGVNYNDSSTSQKVQIDSGELLQLGFDQAVQVSSFTVDLFSTTVSASFWSLNIYQDKGRVYYTDINGTPQYAGSFASGFDFFSTGSTTFGLDLPSITGIDFSAYGNYSDYSLRSVSFSAVASASTVPELDPNGMGAVLCLIFGGAAVLLGRRQAAV